jgi:myo-inositol-1-phosphate synthase
MAKRRIGLWFIGAFGSVGSTAALGLSAIARGIQPPIGMVTGLPIFHGIDLPSLDEIILGGHDIRRTSFLQTVRDLHVRSNIFTEFQLESCAKDLQSWSENVLPGTILHSGSTISALADLPEVHHARSPREAIDRIQTDLKTFRDKLKLDQVVVVNVASTEPPFEVRDEHRSIEKLKASLDRNPPILPASSIYAYAAIDLELPYINFTPSLGASIPALEELATSKKVPIVGKDGKTGETLLKTVLAPMFALRNMHIMSWVGHNILGAGDGRVLADPQNKTSKVKTKDAVLNDILGYKPQTHVSIEYIESLDDWKTAWDHIHFEGFLGVKMTMQFTWQGCDAILAAPLVLDLSRLTLFAHQRGEVGILKHLACFFKSPMHVEEHDFFKQFALLGQYLQQVKGTK